MNHSAHTTRLQQDRPGPGSSSRRHRGPGAQDDTGRRTRQGQRALRCHDVRREEAEQEIRELMQRF